MCCAYLPARLYCVAACTVQGIKTSTMLIDLTVAETKHVGVLIMYEGTLVDPVELNIARCGG